MSDRTKPWLTTHARNTLMMKDEITKNFFWCCMAWQTTHFAYLSNTWTSPSSRNCQIYLVASDWKSIKERQKVPIKTNFKKSVFHFKTHIYMFATWSSLIPSVMRMTELVFLVFRLRQTTSSNSAALFLFDFDRSETNCQTGSLMTLKYIKKSIWVSRADDNELGWGVNLVVAIVFNGSWW